MLSEIKLQEFKWQQNVDYQGWKISEMSTIKGFFIIYKNENLRYPQVFHNSQPFTEIFKITKGQTVYYKEISEIQLLAMYNNVINNICETCQRKQNIIGIESKLVDTVNIPSFGFNDSNEDFSKVSIDDVEWLGPIKIQYSTIQETIGSILKANEFVYAESLQDPNKQFIFHSDQLTQDLPEIKSHQLIYKAINQRQLLEFQQKTLNSTCQNCKDKVRISRDKFSAQLNQSYNNKDNRDSKQTPNTYPSCKSQIKFQTNKSDCQICEFQEVQKSDIQLEDCSDNRIKSGTENVEDSRTEYSQIRAQQQSCPQKSMIKSAKYHFDLEKDVNHFPQSNTGQQSNIRKSTIKPQGNDYLIENQQQFESSISVYMGSQSESRLIESFNINCTQCNNACDEEFSVLECNHSFHINCLKLHIQGQLSTMKCILQCLCNQKIRLQSLLIFDEITISLFRNQLLTNQLRKIIQNNSQSIKKCPNNFCDYIYWMSDSDKKEFKCFLCFNY